jgi:hypothetical protein
MVFNCLSTGPSPSPPQMHGKGYQKP